MLRPGARAIRARAEKGTIKIATQSRSAGKPRWEEGIKLGAQLAVESSGNLEKQGFKVVLVPYDDQAKPDGRRLQRQEHRRRQGILGVIGHLRCRDPSSEVYKDLSQARDHRAATNNGDQTAATRTSTACAAATTCRVWWAPSSQPASSRPRRSTSSTTRRPTGGRGPVLQGRRREEGIKVVAFEGTEEKSNFDPIITPIKAQNPDLIYFGGIYEQAAPFFKQARERGVKSKFMGPDGLDSSDLAKIGGKAVVGMSYTSVAGPVEVYPQAKQFGDEYKKKYGKNPEPFAPRRMTPLPSC